MSDALEALAWKLIATLPKKISKATLAQIATATGIAIDKMRLLREQSTSIAGRDMTDDERLSRLRVRSGPYTLFGQHRGLIANAAVALWQASGTRAERLTAFGKSLAFGANMADTGGILKESRHAQRASLAGSVVSLLPVRPTRTYQGSAEARREDRHVYQRNRRFLPADELAMGRRVSAR
jgi:hypothetical protein